MGHWLFKSNPIRWRIADYLKDLGDSSPVWWTTGKNVTPGDVLFIGASGEDAAILARAVVALEPFISDPEREYYKNPGNFKQKTGCSLDTSSFRNFVTRPISDQELSAIPELERVARWLHIQGGYTRLSPVEAGALEKLAALR